MTGLSFDYRPSPVRVIFGRGAIERTPEAIGALGCGRALVLSTAGRREAAEALSTSLGPLCVGVHAGAVMHTPVSVTEAALEVVAATGADCLVSLGGGSTVGLGKALAWRTGLPHVALPTTYAGSEVTPILGETEGGKKTTFRDPKVFARVVIYDPAQTDGLPPGVSVTSGLNAIAHGVEALYAPDRNPIASIMAAEGVRAMVAALPAIAAGAATADDRDRALYGAWLCGSVLGQVTMGLHHKLCHALGGAHALPHAETHAIILPHATAFNAEAAGDALAPVAAALGGGAPGAALADFATGLGAPRALRDIGMPEDGIAETAREVAAAGFANPRAVERGPLERLLRAAWEGAPPGG